MNSNATTNFRGREWIAFFTPDIPVQEGPWKLYGLPGLILKAYDSKRHYFYEAKDINSKSPGLVEYVNNSDRLVLKDRIKSLKLRNEAKKKDIRQIMSNAFGIKINTMVGRSDNHHRISASDINIERD